LRTPYAAIANALLSIDTISLNNLLSPG
jgi:hypothetical protein